MAQQASVTNLQTVEFNVSGPDGANRVYITTGLANLTLTVSSQPAAGGPQQGSFRALIDPKLTAGQFRKAAAVVFPARFGQQTSAPVLPVTTNTQWGIEEVEATWDDESGKIQLRIDAMVYGYGGGGAFVQSMGFQVTTLAAV